MPEPMGNAEFLYSCTLAMLLPRYEDELTDVRIVGLPTSDGRGPQISMISSVAISAQTSEAEACAAFISTLLSEDIQTEYGTYTDGMPIRISSYEASSSTLLERYNTSVDKDFANYTSEELIMYNSNTKILDESVIDDFEAMIASCEDTASLDPAIEKIVYEEIQAYFADQKSIDDVIELINNRVSLYVSERNG
jgi:ABC-type glycerol-3-phosphate transport system substrate-binding protein